MLCRESREEAKIDLESVVADLGSRKGVSMCVLKDSSVKVH